jgi:choline monooxygenase
MPRFTIDPNIAIARTPHTDLYTDPQLFEHTKERLFASSWQFIGDTELTPAPGDVYPFTLLEKMLDEPLVLVSDEGGALRLLSNVCTHRGNLVVNEPCRLGQLRCRYHGRMFNLDGSFRSMPEFKEVLNFPTPADDLHRLPLARWGKWLFTSLGTSPYTNFWGDIMQRLHWLPLDRYFSP